MPTEIRRGDLVEIIRGVIRDEVKQPTDNAGKLGLGRSGPAAPAVQKRRPSERGNGFALICKALAASGGDPERAGRLLERNGAPEHVTRALGSGDLDSGGAFVSGQLANEVIEALRPMSAVRRAGPRRVVADRGTFSFPKIETGASADYVAEGADLSMASPKTALVNLVPRKLGAVVNFNNELLRFDSVESDDWIQRDLIQAAGTREDKAFLRGTGTENEPTGLENLALAANVFDTAGTSLANKRTDLLKAINKLEGGNIGMMAPAWFMSSRSKNGLVKETDSNGNYVFKDEIDQGRLFGHPLFVTNNIPDDLGTGSDESKVYLADLNEVVIGDVDGVSVETSRDAAFDEDGTMRSAFMADKTLIRVILHNDIAVRYPEAVAVIDKVKWSP